MSFLSFLAFSLTVLVAAALVLRQRRAANEIRKLREKDAARLHSVLASAEAGIFLTDLSGRITEANQASCRMLGYSFQEMAGKKWSALVFRTDENGTSPVDEDGPEAGVPPPERNRAGRKGIGWRKDGSRFDLRLASFPIVQGEDPIGCVRYLYDISEQEKLQNAQQQSNDKLIVWLGELTLRNREAKLMNEMMDWLHSCVNLEEGYEIVARYARQLFPGQFGALFIVNSQQGSMEAVSSWGGAPVSEDSLTTRDCWSLRRGQVHSFRNAQTDMICRHVRASETKFPYVCIPLLEQGEALGVLHLQGTGREAPFAEDLPEEYRESRHQLTINLAERVGLALANMKLRETLRYQAIRDPLTNLFNRRHMEESLLREIHRIQRRKLSMGVLMIDLDYFKQYNDSHGHEAGDLLLKALGNLIRTHIRREDIPCRYGGEEFVIILIESPLADTCRRAETLRELIKGLASHKDIRGPVSVSIGVACLPQHGNDMPTLLRAADQALYDAKKSGRDRVCVARPETETPQDRL